MPRRIRRIGLICGCITVLLCMFAFGANAYTYPSMPSEWQNVQVTVGDVTMPFERYPSGSTFPGSKAYMTVEEQADYGLSLGYDLYLRGYECVAFARYTYAALFYKYPQDATMDTSLAYGYATSYAYRNMIEETLGTKYLDAGYSASTLKTLITSCQPGAVMRCGGHSMAIMAIYDDGMLIYDANYSSTDEVSVRAYTWQSFVSSMGSKDMTALHMPAYYPGYSYSTGDTNYYTLDESMAGKYVVSTTLNIRSLPTTSSTRLGSYSEGDVVDVLGIYNDTWAKVEYNGQAGWIHTDYIEPYAQSVSVTFDANGGTASYTSATYTAGKAFGSLPTATKSARTLLGWTNGSSTYTASSIVPSVESLVLKAKWCVLSYQDVLEDAWYASTVEEAYSLGLISKDTLFNPENYASRAQMVTVLGREYEREYGVTLSGSGSEAFTDVVKGSYYDTYVGWGYKNGIVLGMGDNKFEPDGNVTREQIAVFLYRMAVYTGKTISQDSDQSLLTSFRDGGTVSDYAKSAMCWAVNVGILQGDDRGYLDPQGSATRAHMITMLTRYIKNVADVSPSYTTVTFDPSGGTVDKSSASYVAGSTFGSLPTPTKQYRTFLGWYDGSTQYTASSTVPSSSLTLTAKWQVLGYTDVTEDLWFVSYLEKAYACGLVDGEGTFNASSSVVRSDIVTYMARTYEYLTNTTIPEANAAPFEDVPLSAEYAKYVAWGKENELVKGVSASSFSPDSSATREQISLFLYRLAKFSGVTTDEETDTSVLGAFPDGSTVYDDYVASMSWAVSVGLFSGDENGKLNPHSNATYAEVITLMSRYIDYMS